MTETAVPPGLRCICSHRFTRHIAGKCGACRGRHGCACWRFAPEDPDWEERVADVLSSYVDLLNNRAPSATGRPHPFFSGFYSLPRALHPHVRRLMRTAQQVWTEGVL